MSYISSEITPLRIEKPLRAYQKVWNLLKEPPHDILLSIADPRFIPRIQRMISKEKDLDHRYKCLQGNWDKKLRYEKRNGGLELRIRLLKDTDWWEEVMNERKRKGLM